MITVVLICQGLMVAQKEAESKELLAKLHQERMDSTFQRDMLQYLIQDKVDIEIDDSLLSHRNGETCISSVLSGSASKSYMSSSILKMIMMIYRNISLLFFQNIIPPLYIYYLCIIIIPPKYYHLSYILSPLLYIISPPIYHHPSYISSPLLYIITPPIYHHPSYILDSLDSGTK